MVLVALIQPPFAAQFQDGSHFRGLEALILEGMDIFEEVSQVRLVAIRPAEHIYDLPAPAALVVAPPPAALVVVLVEIPLLRITVVTGSEPENKTRPGLQTTHDIVSQFV